MRAEVERGSEGQGEEIEGTRGDVFAKISGKDGLGVGEVFRYSREELGCEEMDLQSVRRGGIATAEEAVLNRGAAVCVAFDTATSEQMDGGLWKFGEGVFWAEAYS